MVNLKLRTSVNIFCKTDGEETDRDRIGKKPNRLIFLMKHSKRRYTSTFFAPVEESTANKIY
jgi:hypothetical protein